MRCSALFMLLAVAGCSPTGSASSTNSALPAIPSPRHNPDARYLNIPAHKWGKLLADADVAVTDRAVDALGNLGDDGRYYLVEGIKANVPNRTRLFRRLGHPNEYYRSQLTPILKSMLSDKEDAALAAQTLTAWEKDAVSLLPDVRAARKRFPNDRDVKHWSEIIEKNVK